MPHSVNNLTRQIIGSAIEVHRALGPGLLESAYRESLARELFLRRIPIKQKWPVPLDYKGLVLRRAYEQVQLNSLRNLGVLGVSAVILEVSFIVAANETTQLNYRRVELVVVSEQASTARDARTLRWRRQFSCRCEHTESQNPKSLFAIPSPCRPHHSSSRTQRSPCS